ncbi:hypothetical protein [Saccharothrix lopnurensis]|uniref:Uncharacterized protein n=1 Tax=Saccharothrix lopnurensis TaxID=1670621 RepID=A0ABW1PDN0_9PSEU
MLKKAASIAAATTLATVLVQADGQASPARAQEEAFVGGSGTSAVDTRFAFGVFGGEGEEATGFALFRNTAEGIEERLGGITCVNIVGNAAIFKIKDVGSEGGTHRQFFVRDNGPTGEGEPTDELNAYGVPSNESPDKCDKPDEDMKGQVITAGDIAVVTGEE